MYVTPNARSPECLSGRHRRGASVSSDRKRCANGALGLVPPCPCASTACRRGRTGGRKAQVPPPLRCSIAGRPSLVLPAARHRAGTPRLALPILARRLRRTTAWGQPGLPARGSAVRTDRGERMPSLRCASGMGASARTTEDRAPKLRCETSSAKLHRSLSSSSVTPSTLHSGMLPAGVHHLTESSTGGCGCAKAN